MKEKIQNAGSVGRLLLAHPGQARNLSPWASNLKRSPLSARLPWLPFDVIDFLDGEVTGTSRVFEYGGGGSTLWFTERAGLVRTVENDLDWFHGLLEATTGTENSEVLYRPLSDTDAYVGAVADEGRTWDVVVVDGRERVRCVEAAIPHVRPGGCLLLDDTDRPRYAAAQQLLRGWSSRTFAGLAPYKPRAAQTTVWRKPVP